MEPKKSTLQSIAPVLLTALLLFAATAVLGMVIQANSLSGRYSQEESVISDWRFVWSGSMEEIEGDIAQWKLSNRDAPLSQPFGKGYGRMQITLSPSQQARVFQLVTDNSPVKILLGGNEIYNNGYGKEAFVGNRLNLADIPASGQEQTLDVFVSVPFSFSFQANLVNARNTLGIPDVTNMLGLLYGSIIWVVGILAILIAVLLSARNSSLGSMIVLAVTVVASGSWLVVYQLTGHVDYLTSPLFFQGQMFLKMLTVLGVSAVVMMAYRKWDVYTRSLFIAMTICAAAVLAAPYLWLMRALILAFTVMLAGMTVLLSMRLTDCLAGKLPYVRLVFFSFLYAAFVFIFDFVGVFTALTVPELESVSVILFALILFTVTMKQVIYFNIRLEERDHQVQKDTQWISRIMAATSDIFLQKDALSFFTQTAVSLGILIENSIDDEIQGDNPQVGKRKSEEAVRYCAALAKDGGFEEILNEGGVERCDYPKIAGRYEQDTSRAVYYGSNYLDMVYVQNNRIAAVIHYESLKNGLGDNLKNLIRIAYSNISVALDNLQLKRDMMVTQENVLVDLAAISEQKSGVTGRHLKAVSEMVKVLCAELGIPRNEAALVSSASMVHDIGKLAIPDEIVAKKGKLSEEEFAIMKKHVTYGYNMLSKSPGEFMSAAAVIAQQHHEKFDGSGYLGFRGNEIHLYARIVSIIDVFDALASPRSYKDAWPMDEVCRYIEARAGTQFDPEIVAAFKRCESKIIETKKNYS